MSASLQYVEKGVGDKGRHRDKNRDFRSVDAFPLSTRDCEADNYLCLYDDKWSTLTNFAKEDSVLES